MTPTRPTRPERPIGVTVIAVLAVLAAIGAVTNLFLSLVMFGTLAAFGGFLIVFAIDTLAVSIASLVFAYGAWTLRPWAWTLGVVLESVVVVFTLYSLTNGSLSSLVTLGLAAITLWYLFQPSVKAAFGRS